MALLSVTRHGFANVNVMMANISATLIDTTHPGLQDPSRGYFQLVSGTHTSGNTVTYAATTNIDPLASYQPIGTTITSGWRLAFIHHDDNRMSVATATELQIPNSGNITYFGTRTLTGTSPVAPTGLLGARWTGIGGTPVAATDPKTFEQVFLNRQHVPTTMANSYPMSYTLTLSNRGIFLCIWDGSQEEAGQFYETTPTDYFANGPLKWFLIQRPVDRVTGHVRGGSALRNGAPQNQETSRCPVFCVFGSGTPNSYRSFVVREQDVLTPSRPELISVTDDDVEAMINPYQQNCITESGEFVISLMTNLTTSRYKYTDELDMLGTVGAEVIGAGTEIRTRIYGESQDRVYTALYANMPSGTGLRLMVLTKNGVDVENSHV